MSKELEAFQNIKLALAKHLSEDTGVSVEKHLEYIENDTDIENVGKALTPPTEEEVCELLSKHYNGYDVYFRQATQEFIIESEFAGIEDTAAYKRNENIFIELPLPPHLITLIGKFYEGLENNGKLG